VVRLSKRVEYGLIAIRYIALRAAGDVVTAKEIADKHQIPYELVAKVLQRLSRAGLIVSQQGVHGGYALAKNPNEVTISSIINAIEGNPPAIAQCMTDGPESCEVFSNCTIKSPLTKVQANIDQAFKSMTLAEIV
jgi:Rrf2 family protein